MADTKQRYEANKEHYLEYQRQYRKANRERMLKRDNAKRHARLLEAIQQLGGRCSRCLQEYDPVCYDFHHTNPEEKEFTIGENMLVGKERLEAEISKCILLCSNCHRLTHKELRIGTQKV